MNYRILAGLFTSLVSVALVAWGESPFEAPTDGLLLLKNGRTLSGKISRAGDFYVVATAESELQIRVHDAEGVCRDAEDVYRRKLERINSRSAEDRVELAQWCIDSGLFGSAARELTEAYKIDDLHPRIPILERRLRAAMTEVKPTPPKVVAAQSTKPDEDALEQVAKSVSPDSLLEFTTKVQPLLVNYCATAGCHGPRPTSDFQLHRVYLHETRDPRLLRANLAAVLNRVDRKEPQQSKLLTAPLSAHGGAKKPIFHAHNAEHYRQLVAWTTRVAMETSTATARVPSTVENASGTLLQRLPLAPPVNGATEPSIVLQPLPPPEPPAPPAPTATAADPFDPEAFNRRQREAKPEPAPVPTP